MYQGYVQKLLIGLFGYNSLDLAASISLSSLLFGLAYTEQGLVGVVVTAIDALIFSFIKRKFNTNLLATIRAHGFYNSIGVIDFYFTGPIHGL